MSEDALIECECPYCKSALTFLAEQAPTIQECPSCSETIIVPDVSGASCGRVLLPITTDRLRIRPLYDGDRDKLLELMADEEAFQFTDEYPLSEQGVDQWLEEASSPKLFMRPAVLSLGIEISANGLLIGFARIHLLETELRLAAIWLLVGSEHRKQGFGTETARAIVRFAIKVLKQHRVSVGVDCRNAAGIRMLEKAGMRAEGEFLEDHFVKGEWRDTAFFGLLERDLGAD
jgi:RimJ/RimL family protein N-acetyltransferase